MEKLTFTWLPWLSISTIVTPLTQELCFCGGFQHPKLLLGQRAVQIPNKSCGAATTSAHSIEVTWHYNGWRYINDKYGPFYNQPFTCRIDSRQVIPYSEKCRQGEKIKLNEMWAWEPVYLGQFFLHQTNDTKILRTNPHQFHPQKSKARYCLSLEIVPVKCNK
jgi:hypothetical protein